MQLYINSIFNEILECPNNFNKVRKVLLEKSKIGEKIVELAQNENITFYHDSKRKFRYGYMSLIIQIAQNFDKFREKEEVKEYFESIEGWKDFADGEYKQSLENQRKNLGGQKPKSIVDDDDNESSFEVNIDSIMTRFSNFSSSMQNHHQSQQDMGAQDDEEDKKEEDEGPFDHSDDMFRMKALGSPDKNQQDEAATEQKPLEKEYIDSNYWKVDMLSEKSVDELLEEEDL